MTREAYRKHPALNFSSLKNMLVSPAHYKARLETEREETLDMRLGENVHAFILEGIEPKFVTRPDVYPDGSVDQDGNPKKFNANAKVCKSWIQSQTLPILTAEEAERQTRMCKALRGSPQAVLALHNCPGREVPILFEYDGVKLKALLDAYGFPKGQPFILDLKKVQDASPAAFAKRVAGFSYDMQLYLYSLALASQDGLEEPPAGAWQVVEDSEAAVVAHYEFSEDWRENGRRKFEYCIKRWKECTESGKWPAFGDGVLKLDLPRWAEWREE